MFFLCWLKGRDVSLQYASLLETLLLGKSNSYGMKISWLLIYMIYKIQKIYNMHLSANLSYLKKKTYRILRFYFQLVPLNFLHSPCIDGPTRGSCAILRSNKYYLSLFFPSPFETLLVTRYSFNQIG